MGPAGVAGQDPISWSAFRTVPAVEPDARLAWGESEDAFGELYLPDTPGPHPAVVLVHGGCWQSIAGVGYMSHLARALTSEGWAVWSIEFRRIDQPGGSWPGILEDVARATDHLRTVAADHPVDPTRVVAMGHSSGGHLALWLASRGSLPDDPAEGPRLRGDAPVAVAGVVGLAAIADLADYHGRRGGGCGSDVVERLLGRPPSDWNDRLALTSPATRLPLGVPQLLVTGALDSTVPADHGRDWVERARASGDDVRIVVPPDAGHFEVVAPWTSPFAGVRSEIVDFLRRVTAG